MGDFAPKFALYLDGLSATLLGVVTGVGFLIHVFASWYMKGEDGFARFFSYLNLFVASMLLLILADNLLLLYLGWEGVGICSYLLIGFYYHNRDNGKAAIKAFTVTRIGDVFLAIGLFVLFREFGTLDIHTIVTTAPQVLTLNNPTAVLATTMLIGGAFGNPSTYLACRCNGRSYTRISTDSRCNDGDSWSLFNCSYASVVYTNP